MQNLDGSLFQACEKENELFKTSICKTTYQMEFFGCTRPSNRISKSQWPKDKDVLDYVAGLVDTDGCILTQKRKDLSNAISIVAKVDQA